MAAKKSSAKLRPQSYVLLPINTNGESDILTALRGARNISHQLRLQGLRAFSTGTDAYSTGTDAHTLGTSAYSTGTALPNGRVANNEECKHCYQYHGILTKHPCDTNSDQ